MVFAMIVIALQSYERSDEEPLEYRGQLRQMMRDYRRLTAQCLILADVTQPICHMIEALLLFTLGEFGRGQDPDTGIQLAVSMIVRLATKMGYHRDSKHYPAISPFAGEMRRRVWTIIRQIDLLYASQAGIPPMIRARETNTELPRNLYDDELFSDMTVLPPSRPMTEATPMCYIIYKAQLLNVFGGVFDVVQSLDVTAYEEVMKLDQQLREVHANVPPLFKMRPIDESLRDAPNLISQRYSLDILFLRTQVVLHRKFACPLREGGRYAFSRRTAIDSSLEILKHQATLHGEMRPGGRLSLDKTLRSSLTNHSFLLAAMVVCLDMYTTAEAERNGRSVSNDIYDWSQERRASMLEAVERSCSFWESVKNESMEAFKATGILTAMISKLHDHESQLRTQRGGAGTNFAGDSFRSNGVSSDDSNVAPEHSAAMTLGMLSTGAMRSSSANMFAYDSKPATSQSTAPMEAIAGSSSGSNGLTPSFSNGSNDQNMNGRPVNNAAFQGLFPGGMSLGFSNVDVPSIDWVSSGQPPGFENPFDTNCQILQDAWDSYMTGATIDPAGSANTMWMNMDGPFLDGMNQPTNGLDPSLAQASPGAPQSMPPPPTTMGAQPQNPAAMFAGNIFMGALP